MQIILITIYSFELESQSQNITTHKPLSNSNFSSRLHACTDLYQKTEERPKTKNRSGKSHGIYDIPHWIGENVLTQYMYSVFLIV